MKRSHYTITPFWDKKAIKPDGTSRVMITINLNRQQFRVTVKLYSTKPDFQKATKGRGGSESVKQLRKDIDDYINKAEVILGKMPDISKDIFLRFFKSDSNLSLSSKTDVYEFFKEKKQALEKDKRFGAAHNIRCAWYSFRSYKERLFFEDIDAELLKGYKKYMINRGCSETTCGMYLRALKSLYNGAARDGIISNASNPFASIVIRSVAKSKDVLYPEQLKALWEYQPVGIREERAKAFFFFCYLCNGINFKDVGHLKYKNIRGNVLTFIRSKTSQTNKIGNQIQVYLHDEIKNIIEQWGTKSKKPEDHLFPFWNKCRDAKHLDDTIVRYKRVANISLNAIADKLGFDIGVNLGLARHSFATKQKLSGTPISFISDAMGHSSVSVTENYLKSLPDENLKVMSDKLLAF